MCYVFEYYLNTTKKIYLLRKRLVSSGTYICHHASSLSCRAESSLSTYQSRRERSALARSAAKLREVRGQLRP